METVIVWFRSDLRLADNPALHAAVAGGARVVPVYIHAPEEAAPWPAGAASLWWLHHSLASLQASLRALGGGLILRRGPSVDTLRELTAACGASRIYCNRCYEPALRNRDQALQSALADDGIECLFSNGSLLHEPWKLNTKSGNPYRVFTPFWRACQQQRTETMPVPAPDALAPLPPALVSLSLADLDLLPSIAWDPGLHETWHPGEAAAQARLRTFAETTLAHYPEWRDLPDKTGSSRLSPHLHFGEISPRQVAWTLERYAQTEPAPNLIRGAEALVRELGWREFAYHVLYHYPHTTDEPLDARFAKFPWREDADSWRRAWQRGRTGYPIVDAGMRELWHTGWMHNRVRMIVASFLTKNCRIAWQQGARWFWDTLVDADLANNSLNWQWVAGCGADAAPYFRIFNPVTQSRKFDPQGGYLRRWLPELAPLPARWLHEPWTTPPAVQQALGLEIGVDYPLPFLDLKQTREQALAAFRARARRAGRGR